MLFYPMPVFIHDIATALPESFNDQQEIREIMKKYLSTDRRTNAIIHRIYTQSGIEKRHSVLEDFAPGNHGTLFFNGQMKSEPGTGIRNKVYEQESKKLFVETAEKLLQRNPHIQKDEISHVITVSCTGFFAPGPEFEIVKQLKLNPDVQRFHIGFMGCYAAFPALKMAESFCKADPDANILIVCAELCTLHFQYKTEVDSLLSASVFADGAAGVLVSGRKYGKKCIEINKLTSLLADKGEKDMAWTIGDSGFNMVLSTYVPDIIKANLKAVIQPFYKEFEIAKQEVDIWAIHPGGRAILDKIETTLKLEPEQLQASRKVLANYGNMSSATVLFVLKEIFESAVKDKQKIMAMAFGPGLTIESGLMTLHLPKS